MAGWVIAIFVIVAAKSRLLLVRNRPAPMATAVADQFPGPLGGQPGAFGQRGGGA
jgi:hypothetical protein